MSSKLKANCYGFTTGFGKFYYFVGYRNPEKVGKHWAKSFAPLENVSPPLEKYVGHSFKVLDIV